MTPEREDQLEERNASSMTLWTKLARYFVRDLSVKEQAEVQLWINHDPRRSVVVARMRRVWDKGGAIVGSAANAADTSETEAALTSIMDRLGLDVQPASEKSSPPRTGRPIRPSSVRQTPSFAQPNVREGGRHTLRWMTRSVGVAVVLGVIMMLAGWEAGVRHAGQEVSAMSIYTTNPGQRANITLPDGSTVSLGVASQLEVPADYERENHTVRVTGEALFTVAHHDAVPFTVLTGTTSVRVLGTSFVVRNYATDSTTLVAVRDGRVAVRSAVVTAHQQIEVGHEGMSVVRPASSAQFSFANGVLTLDRVPLPAAILELNRWYNADVRLGDPSLRAQQITAKLTAGSLTDLTELLAVTFNVRVVRDGRVLTLFPR